MLANHPKVRKSLIIGAVVIGVLGISPLAARMYIHGTSASRVYSDVDSVPKCHVAVVLGAQVHRNGKLCSLLQDRVMTAIRLYKAGKVDKLLMSGDNRFENYNEPDRMIEFAIAHGVRPQDVKGDYAGRRTYDSIYRAKKIWGLDRFIVVSQSWHADRAVFLGKRLGLDVYGLSSDFHRSPRAEVREFPASVNAILDAYVLHPKPLGGKRETI